MDVMSSNLVPDAVIEGFLVNVFGNVNGFVYGHKEFEDGRNITTSEVQELEINLDGVTATIRTKSGSVYLLRNPMYPTAWLDLKTLERVMKLRAGL
jgi:hypothetical protein